MFYVIFASAAVFVKRSIAGIVILAVKLIGHEAQTFTVTIKAEQRRLHTAWSYTKPVTVQSNGLSNFLDTLADTKHKRSFIDKIAAIVDSHPATSKRIDALNSLKHLR